MKKYTYITSSKGMTLIEILASITILSIIVVSFLTFFLQSARTNNVSEDILDATYVAQSEMEEMYNISDTFSSYTDALSSIHPTEKVDDYTITHKNVSSYYVEIKLYEPNSEIGNVGHVVVEVYNNSSDKKLEAQMETILDWGN